MKLSEIYAELVVRDSSYKRSMTGAKRLAAGVQKNLDAVARTARRMLLGLTAVGAGAIALYAKQEKAEEDLRAALDASGQSAAKYHEKLKAAAAAIQRLTVYGDEAVMPVMSLGLNMGVTADEIDKATRMAIGLSKAFGMDLNIAMRGTALALKGEFTLLNRYIPELRILQDETEKMAALQKRAAAGWAQAQAEARTFAGRVRQLKNEYGDLAEQLGGALLPLARDFVGWLRGAAPKIQRWLDQNKELIPTLAKVAAGLLAVAVVAGPIGRLTSGVSLLVTSIGAAKVGVAALAVGVGVLSYKLGEAISKALGLDVALSRLIVPDAPRTTAGAGGVQAHERHLAQLAKSFGVTRDELGAMYGQLKHVGGVAGIALNPSDIEGTARFLELLRSIREEYTGPLAKAVDTFVFILKRSREEAKATGPDDILTEVMETANERADKQRVQAIQRRIEEADAVAGVRAELEAMIAEDIQANGTLEERLALLDRELQQRKYLAKSAEEMAALDALYAEKRKKAMGEAAVAGFEGAAEKRMEGLRGAVARAQEALQGAQKRAAQAAPSYVGIGGMSKKMQLALTGSQMAEPLRVARDQLTAAEAAVKIADEQFKWWKETGRLGVTVTP